MPLLDYLALPDRGVPRLLAYLHTSDVAVMCRGWPVPRFSRAHARNFGVRIVATDRPLLSEGEGRYFRPDFVRFAVMDGAPGAHVGYAVQEEGREFYLPLGPDSGLLSDRAALPTPSQRGLLRLASAAGRDAPL